MSNLSIIKRQSWHHIETSQLICRANQLTGFYMMPTLTFNELNCKAHAIGYYIPEFVRNAFRVQSNM